MEPIFQCTNLSKVYAGGHQALANVTLSVEPGHIVGLLGPNGSGKTTLIKLLSGLLTPSSGEVRVAGMVPGVQTKALVSYLPERTYLNDWMTVRDLLSFFEDFYKDFDKAKAYDMLQRLHILSDERLRTMSKGTKEKVQLILVMARSAELYLLDEPIGGVDPAARDYILQTILQNYNENATILLSTHLIADIESILDEVIFISNGGIALQASVDDIREQKGESVDAFFREVFKC